MSERWTPEDMPNLTGRIAIVTGANSGIGFETAKEFARKGAETVLACRDVSRARAALEAIQMEIPWARVELMDLDLASLSSVRRFAKAVRATHERLEILVNNAGVMVTPYGATEDGFEQQFGINHLGHFSLTGLLIDRLLASPGSRVVTVTSAAHRYGRMDFENLMFEGGSGYSPFRAYARSKLANLLFTYELERRLAGTETIAVAAHPGGTATNLGRRMIERPLYRTLLPFFEWLSQSPAKGALPSLRAATDPKAMGGQFYGPGGLLGMRGAPVVVQPSPSATDEAVARRLWKVSEEHTDVRFL